MSREIVQENRALVRANREMVEEMRETRIAQDRPHVLVDPDYSYMPALDLVVQNIGRGPAKNIRFTFSPDILNSEGQSLSELAYFKDGLDFLAPGVEVRTFWDMTHQLLPFLEQRGLHDGFDVTVYYESAAGKSYESTWKFDSLRFKGRGYIRRYGMHELADAVRSISKDFHGVAGPGNRALRVSTNTERREKAERLQAAIEAESSREDHQPGES